MPAALALLRAAPLVASSAYLAYALSEDLFQRPLCDDEEAGTDADADANNMNMDMDRNLPRLVRRFARGGIATVFVLYPLAAGTAAANLLVGGGAVASPLAAAGAVGRGGGGAGVGRRARLAGGLYLAGLAFSVLHFAGFARRNLALVDEIVTVKEVEEEEGEREVEVGGGGPKGGVQGRRPKREAMAEMVRLGAVRGLVADVPSWIAAIELNDGDVVES
ncbi:hypothetical protein GGR56DRAFT_672390 [Xylariaceae sp. FL0804]|nr:hypothetical protein GGR56DRAFT_672390 [Xylariaceae sp. FL0804]